VYFLESRVYSRRESSKMLFIDRIQKDPKIEDDLMIKLRIGHTTHKKYYGY
jgi:hypothetical protein